jgi:hypothetical protein
MKIVVLTATMLAVLMLTMTEILIWTFTSVLFPVEEWQYSLPKSVLSTGPLLRVSVFR